jgi:hypothetical protein
MALVFDKTYAENPQIIVVCATPKSGLSGLIFEYEIECTYCPEGTHWDKKCEDCVCDNISILLDLAQAIRGDLDGLRLRSSSAGINRN